MNMDHRKIGQPIGLIHSLVTETITHEDAMIPKHNKKQMTKNMNKQIKQITDFFFLDFIKILNFADA